MSFPARMSPETTWRAEWFANTVSDMQDERQAQKEHRCKNEGA